ncbi:hypothetical protein G3N57_04290 [Paraburkholderia sp. Se-20369]|nr:hypothetical protein [Paraburkholderia sp. Se-20369]
MSDIPIIQLPASRLVEAVKIAAQIQSAEFNAAKYLCDWWNQESGCAPALRCAAIPLLWIRCNDGGTFAPVHPDHGPAVSGKLFEQPLWRSAVAECGSGIRAVFLREPISSDLDTQGFFHAYLVNGAEYESMGIDFYDYKPDALDALRRFPARFSHEYESLFAAA